MKSIKCGMCKLEKSFNSYRIVYVNVHRVRGIENKYIGFSTIVICNKCFKVFSKYLYTKLSDEY